MRRRHHVSASRWVLRVALAMMRRLRATAAHARPPGFAGDEQASVEILRSRVAAGAGEGGHEEQGAAACAAWPHAAIALAAVAQIGRKAGDAGDRLVGKASKLRRQREHAAGGDLADSGNGDKGLLFGAASSERIGEGEALDRDVQTHRHSKQSKQL
jgi:hypothetical protein